MKGEPIMLLRSTDPFRDFDRLTNQLLGTTNRHPDFTRNSG